MPSVKSVIFCDQWRREDNGKLILIGVYTGVMNVRKFPFATNMSMLVILGDMDEPVTAHINLGSEGGATFMELEVEMTPDAEYIAMSDAYVPLPPAPIMLSGPDVIQLSIHFGDEKPAMVAELLVQQGRPPEDALSI